MKDYEKLLGCTRRAVENFKMISEGDKIAVGISGGKDSLVLTSALAGLRKILPVKFEVYGITLDLGFEGADFSRISDYCESIDVPYTVVKTNISNVVFDIRQEKNPCALCAKMRRGALAREAAAIGCGKLALGHHKDDVVDTFMLNLIHGGRLSTFEPVTYLSRSKITVIRPLIYLREYETRNFAKSNSLPVVKSLCPADGGTERASMKETLDMLDFRHRGIRGQIFGAIERSGIDGWHECRRAKKERE
ncbi:MAG: tRNA 2-thiocytidine(32) synthetase TtcA [Clostridia bacterium]|nr:tRNA 2-thiocytidine(32) synthetase TtcA [Clostridia bacterium]